METPVEVKEIGKIETPTVKEVLSRPFARPDSIYKVGSALFAKDGPTYLDHKGRLSINPLTGQVPNCTTDALTIVKQIVPLGHERKLTHTDQEKAELKAYYEEQFKSGVELLINHGYIPRELANIVTTRMLNGEVDVVDGAYSGFGYVHLVFPDGSFDISISPGHVEGNTERLERILKAVGLDGRLTKEEIEEIGAKTAIMHEFGHGVERTIQILLAAKVMRERPDEFEGATPKDLKDVTDAQQRWKLYQKTWDAVDEVLVKNYLEIENSDRLQVIQELGTNGDVADSYVEAISTGCEEATLDACLEERNFTEEERKRLFDYVKEGGKQAIADFKYFIDVLKSREITTQSQYHDAIGSAFDTRKQGIVLHDHVPYYGPHLKQIGYSMPLYPEHFRVITRLVDPKSYSE